MDGRVARSERSRRAIVAAHLALIDEGDLRPTGERIAGRAGLSVRSLWTNFKDMESLYAATGALVNERRDALHRPVPADLPLAERVALFCAQRAEALEMLAPSARASALREPFSAALRANRAANVARVRAHVEETFAAELALAGVGREPLADALTVACTWSTWSMLRDILHLSIADARANMHRTMWGLLMAPIPTGATPSR
ncbi:TetR family transcriptional regulator [Asanoa ferruginea]|uniref:TetR family transcriptional regulator n=1 Tax=Asanoa ferruginea TaxID=53367 RepID=A0A3D9ZNM6_9ACTN|nr:TetR/AcrR family transcriptional regulator [Asanoa ferruginea]REF98976.1 TetR family transcriptional regulator [Asanoa ferruginea]GIF46342.1 transcriptional regulator [Asanoa ferruginea]